MASCAHHQRLRLPPVSSCTLACALALCSARTTAGVVVARARAQRCAVPRTRTSTAFTAAFHMQAFGWAAALSCNERLAVPAARDKLLRLPSIANTRGAHYSSGKNSDGDQELPHANARRTSSSEWRLGVAHMIRVTPLALPPSPHSQAGDRARAARGDEDALALQVAASGQPEPVFVVSAAELREPGDANGEGRWMVAQLPSTPAKRPEKGGARMQLQDVLQTVVSAFLSRRASEATRGARCLFVLSFKQAHDRASPGRNLDLYCECTADFRATCDDPASESSSTCAHAQRRRRGWTEEIDADSECKPTFGRRCTCDFYFSIGITCYPSSHCRRSVCAVCTVWQFPECEGSRPAVSFWQRRSKRGRSVSCGGTTTAWSRGSTCG